MTTVYVRRLEVYAYHGVSDEEQRVGHRLRIDIEAQVEQDASTSDDVGQTVNYGELALLAKQIAETESYRTLERLAAHVAESALAHFPAIRSLTLSIAKPAPPIAAIAEEVGIRMVFANS